MHVCMRSLGISTAATAKAATPLAFAEGVVVQVHRKAEHDTGVYQVDPQQVEVDAGANV